jgi:hypothetical protein
MSVATNKEEFVARMAEALGEAITNPNNPSEDQVRRYFRTLNGRTQDAIDAYEGYASLFYIHVAQSGNPHATVTYPGGAGGRLCDSLAEVHARRSESGRHVIDCNGFAVMGVTLLADAGFQFSRYMVAVPPGAITEDWSGHIFAEMIADGRRIYVGNDDIHDSPSGAVEGIIGWSPDDEVNVRYGSGDTIQEATDDADEIVATRRESPQSDPSSLGLFHSRRSLSPPVSGR